LSADETIYGRYGGRDAKSAEGRMSLAGLHYALKAALDAHRRAPKEFSKEPARKRAKPLRVDDYPAARRLRRGGCIHCHQVYEFRREQEKAEGKWSRQEVWRYPLPENVGLMLDVDQGDRVLSVEKGSAAEQAGLRKDDLLQTLNRMTVASLADVQYALH